MPANSRWDLIRA